MNAVEKDIAKQLEDLVGRRFNNQTLEAELSKIFKQEIGIADVSRDDDELVDFNLLTGFDNEELGIYGYADIYFLPMRREGFDNSTFYVTEVAVEFE